MSDEIQLVIADRGSGFDVEKTKGNGGLGLLSMQERIHLVHGRLSVESKLGSGTRIFAVVPLSVENDWAVEGEAIQAAVGLARMA